MGIRLSFFFQNNIPVFSPAITDGGIGDEILYLHQRNKNNNLRIDIAEGTVYFYSITEICMNILFIQHNPYLTAAEYG